MPLSRKRQRFVAEYLKDLNAAAAARRAGYTSNRADQAGYELLSKPDVAAAIADGSRKALSGAELSASRVLEEYRRLAFQDVRALFDESGNLLPVHKLPADVAASIASVEVIKRNLTSGDGSVDVIHKVKTWDKGKALDSLSRYFGLDKQVLEHTGGIDVRWLGPDDEKG